MHCSADAGDIGPAEAFSSPVSPTQGGFLFDDAVDLTHLADDIPDVPSGGALVPATTSHSCTLDDIRVGVSFTPEQLRALPGPTIPRPQVIREEYDSIMALRRSDGIISANKDYYLVDAK